MVLTPCCFIYIALIFTGCLTTSYTLAHSYISLESYCKDFDASTVYYLADLNIMTGCGEVAGRHFGGGETCMVMRMTCVNHVNDVPGLASSRVIPRAALKLIG